MRRAIAILVLCIGCGGEGPGTGDDASLRDEGPLPDAGTQCVTAADCVMATVACRKAACSAAGQCVLVADETRDGLSCDPDDRCALEPKTCQAGACVYGLRRACPSRTCGAGRCEPDSGECVFDDLADGSVCEADGNPCTADACRSGACVTGENTCACSTDPECPVNADACLPRLRCDAGLGRCLVEPETGVVCPPSGEACRENACDAESGACVLRIVPDGTACPAADRCVTDGFCVDGQCIRAPRCRDDNPCTRDDCDLGTGACTFVPLDGAVCDDGDDCTEADVCDGTVCRGAPRDCDDENPCTDDACIPGDGCVSAPAEDGPACDDGDPCTDDACDGLGKCVGTPVACDDGNPCTDDACDPETGACVRVPNSRSCDDGESCTDGDICVAGACLPGRWIPGCCHHDDDCQDGNPCTRDSCILGGCEVAPESGKECRVTGSGCLRGWCDIGSGDCREVDASRPERLVDWDWLGSEPVAGFAWAGYPGVVGPAGAGPAGDGQDVSVRLPRQWIEAGVRVVHAVLGAGTCDRVDLMVDGAVLSGKACTEEAGRPMAAWAWNGPERLLDARVVIRQGGAVGRLSLFAWAHPECRPLQPETTWVPGEGIAPTHLRVAGNGSAAVASVFVAGPSGDGSGTVEAVSADLFGDAGNAWRLIDTFTPHQARFGGALATLPDGRFVAAHGGVGWRIKLELVDLDGTQSVPTELASLVPGAPAGRVADAEPAVVVDPWGSVVLAWAFTNLDTQASEIALVRGAVESDRITFPALATRISPEGAAGRAREPRLWLDRNGGVIAWVTDLPTTPATRRIALRRLSPTGELLTGVDLPATQAPVSGLTMTGDGTHVYLAWEESTGVLAGRVVSRENFEQGAPLVFTDPLTGAGSPTLLQGETSVMLVFASRVGGTLYRVVAGRVSSQGVVGPEQGLSQAVIGIPAVTAARSGSYLSTFAFHAAASETGRGLRQGVFADGCVLGNVDCSDAVNPRVCTGLPGMAYVTCPDATRWCQ